MKIKYQKVNLIIVISCLVLIGFLTIGYANLNANLNINTTATIRADISTRITNLSNPTFSNGANEIYNSRYTENTITNNLNLPNLNSAASYTVTITNNSTRTMKISAITDDVFNNDNMTYEMTGASEGTIIEAGNSITFTILFQYKANVLSLPENTNLGSVLTFTFEEYVAPVLTYATGNMLLNLEGLNAPVNNTWVDTTNNKTITLSNVNYDSTNHLYDFGSSGYGTLGETLIPSTGDFTLEAYILTPTNITSDQAIVAQVSDTSNDSGRVKLNLYNNNLLTFINTQSSGSKSYYFVNGATASGRYLLQLVRTGESLNLYLNGVLIVSNTYASTNTISTGPFKLGRWNNASNQHYYGSLFSVRLYNRALSADELLNNYTVDTNHYPTAVTRNNLYNYVLANQVVTTGDGLYNTGTDSYLYKGVSVNNYLKFSDTSDTYRIVNFNADGSMKIMSTNLNNNVAFDAAGNRVVSSSAYCTNAATNGCNFYATTTSSSVTLNTFTGVVTNDSTTKTAVDSWYSALDTTIKNKIISHSFGMGYVSDTSTYANALTQANNIIYTGYAGLIGVDDVLKSTNTTINQLATTVNFTSYLISLSNTSTQIWTINGTDTDSWDEWCISYGSQISRKRASRTNQANGSVTSLFYVLPAFYVSSNQYVTGTGTSADPFIIQN